MTYSRDIEQQIQAAQAQNTQVPANVTRRTFAVQQLKTSNPKIAQRMEWQEEAAAM